jgi:hypothetical protein
MAESITSICNQSLARFGGKRISDYDDASATQVEAIQCRLHYEQTAKALMRSHWWRFAKDRVQLSGTGATPICQWDYAYHLPSDFLRAYLVYDGTNEVGGDSEYDYELEGKKLLTNEDEVFLKYIQYVVSPADWDPLFTELMILWLARKLVIPISQDWKIKADIDRDIAVLMPRIRSMDRNESYHVGRVSLRTWREARYSDTA